MITKQQVGEKLTGWRNNRMVRIGFIVLLMLIIAVLYFRNVDTGNLNSVEGVKSEMQANFKPDTTEKKVLLGLFSLMGAALGMEVAKTDFDLSTMKKVFRDKEGNIVKEEDVKAGKVVGKATDDYDCKDFSTQPEAQKFYDNAGGVTKDTNRLDGDKNGIACQSLPKTSR